jgi:hypothetical protein
MAAMAARGVGRLGAAAAERGLATSSAIEARQALQQLERLDRNRVI